MRQSKPPGFFLSFFVSGVLLLLAAFLHRGQPQFGWLVAAALLQLLGKVGVTAVGNIPLDNRLAEVDVKAVSEVEEDRIRTDYQGPRSAWLRSHAVRTSASIAAATIATGSFTPAGDRTLLRLTHQGF